MLLQTLIAVLSIASFTKAAKCPTITTQNDFDVTKVSFSNYVVQRNRYISIC